MVTAPDLLSIWILKSAEMMTLLYVLWMIQNDSVKSVYVVWVAYILSENM